MKTKIQHPIDAFGILKVSMSGIRAEKLEERIKPTLPFPHRHDFYQIILVSHGSGTHQIDFDKFSIGKNQVFIMRPGQVHSWKLSKNIKGHVIEFNRDAIIDKGLITRLDNSKQSFNIKDNELFKFFLGTAKMLEEEFSHGRELYNLCLRGYLTGLLAQLSRYSLIDGFIYQPHSLIERFQHLVEDHFREEHRVEFYAKKLGTGAKSLTMQVTRALGKSPRSIIQDRFMLEAKRFLAYSNISISEIGNELGFEDANYFSRFFRQHQGVTPLHFRKVSTSF